MNKYCLTCFKLFKEGEYSTASFGTIGITRSFKYHENCIWGKYSGKVLS